METKGLPKPSLISRFGKYSSLLFFPLLVLYGYEFISHRRTLAQLHELRAKLSSLRQADTLASVALPLSGSEPEAMALAVQRQNPPDREAHAATEAVPSKAERTTARVVKHNRLDSKEMKKWILDSRLEDVEKFLVLTDDERERLKIRFDAEQQAIEEAMESGRARSFNEEQNIPGVESLDDIMGPERAQRYRQGVKDRQTRVEEERVENRVFWLTRKLDLAPEQEVAVKEAVTQVEGEMNKYMKEYFENRSLDEEADKSDPRDFMEDFSTKRRTMLNEMLRGTLSDEQYNKLIEEQEKSPMNFFGFMPH